MGYPEVIEQLIERLMKLPGVGRRSAERMIFWMLNATPEDTMGLAVSIKNLKEKLRFCKICNNFTEQEHCKVCEDVTRDQSIICVVENPKDAVAIESTGTYNGRYFVLLGTVLPSEGQGPEDLHLHKLMQLVREKDIQEVVLATDADMDGELTALHITKMLTPLGVKISRIGIGLPAGGAVEFADMSTLAMSLKSRRSLSEPEPKPKKETLVSEYQSQVS